MVRIPALHAGGHGFESHSLHCTIDRFISEVQEILQKESCTSKYDVQSDVYSGNVVLYFAAVIMHMYIYLLLVVIVITFALYTSVIHSLGEKCITFWVGDKHFYGTHDREHNSWKFRTDSHLIESKVESFIKSRYMLHNRFIAVLLI